MMKLLVALLIITNALLAWRWYTLEQELSQRDYLSQTMEKHVLELEKQVLTLEKSLAEAEAKTLSEQLSEELFDGWGELLDEFKNQVEETRKKIEKQIQPDSNDQTQNDQTQNDQMQNNKT